MADDILGPVIPLRAVFFGIDFAAGPDVGVESPLAALFASPDIDLPREFGGVGPAVLPTDLPLQITVSVAYLDGALEGEHPEILKQWGHIRRFVMGDRS